MGPRVRRSSSSRSSKTCREEGGAATGRGPQSRRHRRLQYLLDPNHGHRRRDRGRGADGRRALLESSAADADGRGHSWRRNGRGGRRADDGDPARARQATGAGRSRRAGLRLEPAPAGALAGGGLAGRERRRLAGDGRRDRARRAGAALALHRAISNRGPRRRGDVRAGGEPPLAGAVDGDLAPEPATVARRVAGDDSGRSASGAIADWPPTCEPTSSARLEPDHERPTAERGADPARAAGGRSRAATGRLPPLWWGRAWRSHAVGAAAGRGIRGRPLGRAGGDRGAHPDRSHRGPPWGRDLPQATDSPLLPQVVEWGLLLGEQRTIDLVEARQKIEVDIAGLAAQRRTDDDLDDLERILARMEQESRDGAQTAAFVDADVEFHLRLAGVGAELGPARRALQHPGAAARLDRARHRRGLSRHLLCRARTDLRGGTGARWRVRRRTPWTRICARPPGGCRRRSSQLRRAGGRQSRLRAGAQKP